MVGGTVCLTLGTHARAVARRSRVRRITAAFVLTALSTRAVPEAGGSSQVSPVTNSAGSLIGLAPAVPTVRGVHVDAVPSTGTEIVTLGKAFSIRADITPKSGVHVYAPGNASYRPVTLSLDPQSRTVAGPVKYPAAAEFFFAPLKERVRVFSNPFRLERDVTLTPAAALTLTSATALTLKGALEYQACDDKICYLPVSLPLTWTVTLKR
jgi:Disulphide bond corrector protein DsbC